MLNIARLRQAMNAEDILLPLRERASGKSLNLIIWSGKSGKGISRLVGWLLSEGCPVAFLKVAERPDPRLDAEHRALQSLYSLDAESKLGHSFPVWAAKVGDALITPYFEGIPLWAILRKPDAKWGRRRNPSVLLARVLSWLSSFHRLTNQHARQQGGTPVGTIHGDFSPHNILVSRNGGIYIIDWEMSAPDVPLVYDVFFLISYMLGLATHPSVRAPLLPFIREVLRSYGEAMNIDHLLMAESYGEFLKWHMQRREKLGLERETEFWYMLPRLYEDGDLKRSLFAV